MKELLNVVNGAAKAVETAIGGVVSVFDVILKPNMELTEIAKIYGTRLDEMILSEEKKGLTYVGGSFNIIYVNVAAFETSYELYFQDKKKDWVKKEAKSKPQKMSFLKPDAQTELLKAKKVSFEIDPPSPPPQMPQPQNVSN